MTRVNLIIFGIGNVGSTLIKQLIDFKAEVKANLNIDIQIPIIANSQHVFFNSEELDNSWDLSFNKFSVPYKVSEIIDYVNTNFSNAIVIDATASTSFVENYVNFVENGFHIVAANKIANTLDFSFYKKLRDKLKQNGTHFLYETNVGAGLPVVDTIKSLRQSGEKIYKIRGVFSGSLSYIFNRYSNESVHFSDILNDATHKGYTEPDARDDLSGKDVARKLLILGREVGLQKNLDDIRVESLVPKQLNGKTSLKEFNDRVQELNPIFKKLKTKNKDNKVLRYVGELDLIHHKYNVKLVSEPSDSPLGQLKEADTLFEIYTSAYNKTPMIIQGAGAGREVTARGVFSDILRVAHTIH